MAHEARGRRTGTYEIQQLLEVDLDRLEIRVRQAGAFEPLRVALRVEPTAAARQMLQAMADSIKVGDNGDADSGWESSATLTRSVSLATRMLRTLSLLQIDDFAEPILDVPRLRGLYQHLPSNSQRSACWLLARVVRDNHPDGQAISVALKNTRFRVVDTDAFTYDDAVADAIEQAARGVYTDRYTAQRDLFARLGHEVSGRDWLRIPADDLIEWARVTHSRHTEPLARQPSFAASYEEQIAWALTHPEMFGRLKHVRTPRVRGPRMREIGEALYADHVLITAALVLHCLGENSGFNLSVLLEKNVDSLVYLGSDHALEHNVKARSKLQDTRPTRLSSIYTPGGIVETLTGLTRFARHARAGLINPDGSVPPVLHRLYVEHVADAQAACVIDGSRYRWAWETVGTFDRHWDPNAGPREQVPLRMAALRLIAQRRAMAEGLTADVHGHSPATKMHYLAHVLPDHVFNTHATAAQDAMHDEAVARFTIVADATDGVASELAAVPQDQIMDVEVGLCTSTGNAPDGSGRRCDLGMVACFTCPNGYRTVDHVPGLLAAVELADTIEAHDPVEWERGQAGDLRFYAQACLDQFPAPLVASIRQGTNLDQHRLTVTGMYMEMRHG